MHAKILPFVVTSFIPALSLADVCDDIARVIAEAHTDFRGIRGDFLADQSTSSARFFRADFGLPGTTSCDVLDQERSVGRHDYSYSCYWEFNSAENLQLQWASVKPAFEACSWDSDQRLRFEEKTLAEYNLENSLARWVRINRDDGRFRFDIELAYVDDYPYEEIPNGRIGSRYFITLHAQVSVD